MLYADPPLPLLRRPTFLTPLGRKWFDCAECHHETQDHPLLQKTELTFACKKCKKAFRKDYSGEADESDEYCPHCDNHFVLTAVTPQAALKVESEDVRVDARMLKDDRVNEKDLRTVWDGDEEKLG